MQVEFVIPAWKMTGIVALRPEGAWHKLAKHRNKKEDTGSGKEQVGERRSAWSRQKRDRIARDSYDIAQEALT